MSNLIDVLPNLQSFKDKIIRPLELMWEGAEWLENEVSYTKQETIYKLLIFKYGDRKIRYDDDNVFINKFLFDLADYFTNSPSVYHHT